MYAPLTSEQISQHFAGFVPCDATPAAAIDAVFLDCMMRSACFLT